MEKKEAQPLYKMKVTFAQKFRKWENGVWKRKKIKKASL